MEIKRTACAGCLLTLDGKKLLLDGVGREVKPYPATPYHLQTELLQDKPDALLITHQHADHYDAAFVSEYVKNTAGPVIGPADIPFSDGKAGTVGPLQIRPVLSRHIGKTEPIEHISFVITGSQCVWFTGDASPLQWRGREDLQKPDVLIAPYAYAIGSGWQITKTLAPKVLVLLHLPDRSEDGYGLWEAVEQTIVHNDGPNVLIPQMGETVTIH